MNNKLGLSVKVVLVVMMSASVPIVAQAAIPGRGERIRRSDAAIKVDVERTLRADRALNDSRIDVKSVTKGVVLLGGTATSSSDDFRAPVDGPSTRCAGSVLRDRDRCAGRGPRLDPDSGSVIGPAWFPRHRGRRDSAERAERLERS
jgi:hypothetical protein